MQFIPSQQQQQQTLIPSSDQWPFSAAATALDALHLMAFRTVSALVFLFVLSFCVDNLALYFLQCTAVAHTHRSSNDAFFFSLVAESFSCSFVPFFLSFCLKSLVTHYLNRQTLSQLASQPVTQFMAACSGPVSLLPVRHSRIDHQLMPTLTCCC